MCSTGCGDRAELSVILLQAVTVELAMALPEDQIAAGGNLLCVECAVRIMPAQLVRMLRKTRVLEYASITILHL